MLEYNKSGFQNKNRLPVQEGGGGEGGVEEGEGGKYEG